MRSLVYSSAEVSPTITNAVTVLHSEDTMANDPSNVAFWVVFLLAMDSLVDLRETRTGGSMSVLGNATEQTAHILRGFFPEI